MQVKPSTIPADVRSIRYVSLASGTLGAMFGEFELAVQTGIDPWFAAAYPIALDAYAYVAFRTGRKGHVATALALMAVSQAATHLVSAHILPMCWPVVVLVWAVILPMVICLTHNVAHAEPVQIDDEPAAIVEPVAHAEPVQIDDEPAAIVEPVQIDDEPTDDDEPAALVDDEPAAWIGPGRRNWRLSDAVAFVRENADKDKAELARLMGRTERQIANYLRAAQVAA